MPGKVSFTDTNYIVSSGNLGLYQYISGGGLFPIGTAGTGDVANVMHLTGNETVSGTKTFDSTVNFSGNLKVRDNNPLGIFSSALGGWLNTAGGHSSFVGAGAGNTTSGAASVIVGGVDNTSYAPYSFIGAGIENVISGNTSSVYSAVAGGQSNFVFGPHCAIMGGYDNYISGDRDFIGGGHFCRIFTPEFSWGNAIGGGYANTIRGSYSFMGGGGSNTIESNNSSIVGGYQNSITQDSSYSCILGGENCEITSGSHNSVGGGYNNDIEGGSENSNIGGGSNNTIDNSLWSVIAGGETNIIQDSEDAAILGGYGNTISNSDLSFAIGTRANVTHQGAGVIGDGQFRTKNSIGNYTLSLDFSGGVYLPFGLNTNYGYIQKIFLGGVPGNENAFGGLWIGNSQSTATTSNYTLLFGNGDTFINAPIGGRLQHRINNQTYMLVDSNGTAFPGVANTNNETGHQVLIKPSAISKKGLVVRANAGQTGNLVEVQNASSGTVSYIDSTGDAYFKNAYRTGANTNTSGELVTYDQAVKNFNFESVQLNTAAITTSGTSAACVVNNLGINIAAGTTLNGYATANFEVLARNPRANTSLELNKCSFEVSAVLATSLFATGHMIGFIVGAPPSFAPYTGLSGIPNNPCFGFIQYDGSSGRFFWANGTGNINWGSGLNIGNFTVMKEISLRYNKDTRVLNGLVGLQYAPLSIMETFQLTGALATDNSMGAGAQFGIYYLNKNTTGATVQTSYIQRMRIAQYP